MKASTKASSRSRALLLVALVLMSSLVVAACGADATLDVMSPELGAKLVAEAANMEIEVAPTPEPVLIANLTEEEIYAGLPDDFAAALESASAENGQSLTLANGCIGCHSLDPAVQLTGPSWVNAGDNAANRVAGSSPALYLYTSITDPNAHVVQGYPQSIMPQNYRDLLGEADIADLVSYLLSLHQ